MEDSFKNTSPYSKDAEEGLVGSILQSPAEAMDDISGLISSEAFFIAAYKTVFETIHEMWDRESPIDPISVAETLEGKGMLDAIGGRRTIGELFTCVASHSGASHYAKIIAGKYKLRKVLAAAKKCTQDANDNQHEPDAVVELSLIHI